MGIDAKTARAPPPDAAADSTGPLDRSPFMIEQPPLRDRLSCAPQAWVHRSAA